MTAELAMQMQGMQEMDGMMGGGLMMVCMGLLFILVVAVLVLLIVYLFKAIRK